MCYYYYMFYILIILNIYYRDFLVVEYFNIVVNVNFFNYKHCNN